GRNVIVLNSGSADYATRAWCMLELTTSAVRSDATGELLNRAKLDASLHAAQRDAEGFAKIARSLRNLVVIGEPGSDATEFYRDLTRNREKLMVYNAVIESRN